MILSNHATTAPRPGVLDLAPAWEELADRCGAAPFAHPGWLLPWADSAGVRLDALTTWRGNRLTGVLPIIRGARHLRTPANWHTPWFEAVAADEEAHRALAGQLAGSGCTAITVDFVLEGEPTARSARDALTAAGYHRYTRERLASPYVPVHGTWEDYLGSLSGHRRSELRRRARRLEAAGVAAHEVHDGSRNLPALLTEAFAIEAAGWKGNAGTAIACDPALATFYRQVAAWAAERGHLQLAFLRLDGRALAFDLCLESQGRHYLIKTGFDPAFGALAPGLLLRLLMLQRAFEHRLRTYEFCGAAEPWKLEWAPATRVIQVVEAYAPTTAGSLRRATDRALRFARTRAAVLRGGR